MILSGGGCGDEPAAASGAAGGCLPTGSLRVAIHGGLSGNLDWQGADLTCSGMPRPNGEGARLHFSGTMGGGGEERTLAFIIGLPELERAGTVRETPAIVTLIEENSGRFFSSTDAPVCWSDVTRQALITGDEYEIRGIVYCMSPLAQLNGSGGVTFTELGFSGRLDWRTPN